MELSNFFISTSQLDLKCPSWIASCETVLGTAEMLPEVVDRCIEAGRFGLDTEGTGRDIRVYQGRTQSELVGFSVAPTPTTSWYFPLAHKQSSHLNLPRSIFAREMRRLFAAMQEKRTRAILFNAAFDQEMLAYCGLEDFDPFDELGGWEDAHLLVCLEDSRRKKTALKTVAEEDWGWEVIQLDTLFSAEERSLPDFRIDFSLLDPATKEVLWYTCQDALLHLRIFDDYYDRVVANPRGPKMRHQYKVRPSPHDPKITEKPRPSQALIYQVEKGCVLATRWMTRNQVGIDVEKARHLIELGQREWVETVRVLYETIEKTLGRDVMPEKYRYLAAHVGTCVDADLRIVDILSQCEAKSPKDRAPAVTKHGVEYPGTYDLNSPQQLGKLLLELEIPDLRRTEASKQVGTSDEDIEAIAEKHGDKFPTVKLIGKMREINKALSTYLLPLYQAGKEGGGSAAVSWKQMGTDTGRFATPVPKEHVPGWLMAAFQTLPTDKGDRAECMRRIREVICGRDGRFVTSCIAENTLIHTSRGLLPIQTVRAGDEVVTEEGFKKVSVAFCTGTRETIRLRTARGFEVDLTPDHLVRTIGPEGLTWKKAGQLQPGSWVVQAWDYRRSRRKPKLLDVASTPHEKKIRLPKKLSVTIAEILGRFIGDGCVGHSKGIPRLVGFSLGLDVKELLPILNAQTQKLFGVGFQDRAGKGDCFCFSSRLARWFLKNTGKTDGNTCSTPPCILEADTNLQAAFLRGLFDADGHASPRPGDGVSIWITSESLAIQVHLMLLGCGIPARRTPEERDTNFGHCSGWILSITGVNYLRRFHAVVGFITPRKKAALEALLSDGKRRDISEYFPLDLVKLAVPRQRHSTTNRLHTNGRRHGRVSRRLLEQAKNHPEDICIKTLNQLLDRSWAFDQVAGISSSKIARVYDLKVPGLRQFQAGGIITHNCDFSGVELRIVTSLSGEPKWVDAFFKCSSCGKEFDRGDGVKTPEAPPPRCPDCGSDRIGDLHTGTAMEVLGADPGDEDWKTKRGQGKCVHPDTILLNAVGQPFRIGSLPFPAEEDQFLHLPSGRWVRTPNGSARILSTYKGGDKILHHVVTTRGILTCSARHGFQLADGSVRSIEQGLRVGQALADVSSPTLPQGRWDPVWHKVARGIPAMAIHTSPALAYVAGLFLGCGKVLGEDEVCLAHGPVGKVDATGIKHEIWQQTMVAACEIAGFEPASRRRRITLGGRHVLRFLAALALVDSHGAGKIHRIPAWVWDAGTEGLTWFLGGLFAAKGTFSEGRRLGMVAKDAVFAGQVAAALTLLGFSPRPSARLTKDRMRHQYVVQVDGGHLEAYLKHLGKVARIRACQPARDDVPHRVEAIVPAGPLACVDISIDSEDHLYWSNGLSTHNTLNFALVYGGGGDAASAAIGCDKNEGWRLNRQFGSTYVVLKKFWDSQHQVARRDYYVTSPFGRVIPLLNMLSEFRTVVSEAERNAVNGPVQSGSADITKISMMLIYREVKRRGWQDKVLLIGTVHDELVFEIHPSLLEEAADLFVPLMCRNPLVLKLNWPIPLTSDVEIGRNWSVPWNLLAMRAGEVRYLGDKKIKKPEEAVQLGAVWDDLPTFPQTLLPHFKKRDLGYKLGKKGASATAPAWIALDAGSELSEALADQIALVVARCRGSGTTLMRLRASGDYLADWSPGDVLVDAKKVQEMATPMGLRCILPG